ncbi:GyrI-like domain-containing protein [Nonomuraea spiralis]|uniref:GyrI-like domain-containing protein n=1 Tax=Nonomuraea spiralis TaxID=46182 RepID=UPI0037BC63E4
MTTIEVQHREPQPVASIRQTVPITQLTQAQGESLHELWRLLNDRGVAPAGPPFVRYHTFDDDKTDVEVGVPVAGGVSGEGRITPGELPGGPAVVTVHLGAHDRLGEAYSRIEDWLASHGRPGGAAWEIYEWIDLTREPDPSSWPAPADWHTEVVQPLI